MKVRPKDLLDWGIPQSPAIGMLIELSKKLAHSMTKADFEQHVRTLASTPASLSDHPDFQHISAALTRQIALTFTERAAPAPYQIWGEGLEDGALMQMRHAARLPIAVCGALMPDAHQGYGLPIGGVLACDNAVIPYAVGVDIACRMKLTVYPVPATEIDRLHDSLCDILTKQTVFGAGATWRKPQEHPVLEEDWNVSPITKKYFDKAASQLSTSGSGNHFVEFGSLTLTQPDLGLQPGQYLSLLSHSGSRGTGAMVANHYSQLARDQHPQLPPELKYLAWLTMDSDAGREYFAAMELMGKYASANHALIHQRITKALGQPVAASVENHHNFAWKEVHQGRELIVHRKGATPAGPGVLGVIPGSMATPGFVVRGKGLPASLHSASHGAGRAMSRTAAKNKYRWQHIQPELQKKRITLLSAGIDENPHAYKNIHTVMDAQRDLIDIVAQFDPRIVRMAPEGEQPED